MNFLLRVIFGPATKTSRRKAFMDAKSQQMHTDLDMWNLHQGVLQDAIDEAVENVLKNYEA